MVFYLKLKPVVKDASLLREVLIFRSIWSVRIIRESEGNEKNQIHTEK